jgi:hypothetical protein
VKSSISLLSRTPVPGATPPRRSVQRIGHRDRVTVAVDDRIPWSRAVRAAGAGPSADEGVAFGSTAARTRRRGPARRRARGSATKFRVVHDGVAVDIGTAHAPAIRCTPGEANLAALRSQPDSTPSISYRMMPPAPGGAGEHHIAAARASPAAPR